MAPLGRVLSAAACLLALSAWPAPAAGYIYNRAIDFGTSATVYIFSEGPMFATGEGPFNSDGDSYVTALAAFEQNSRDIVTSTVVNVAFLDEDNVAAMGYKDPQHPNASPTMCCTYELAEAGVCERRGELVIRKSVLPAGVEPPLTGAWPFTSRSMKLNATHVVRTAGRQWALVAVCDTLSTTKVDVSASLTYHFHNPYGYLPGLWYALLPFYGILSIAYLIILIVYSVVFIKNRDMLLPLQYCILAVMVLGSVESCLYFYMFTSKNGSGVAPCCPVTVDVLAAVVMNVIKTTVSRVLLLAVCLGFGVVTPTLSKKTSAAVLALGMAHLAINTINDVEQASATEVKQSFWDFGALVLNFTFLFWIYYALVRIREQLKNERQTIKLGMYNSLASTLKVFVVVWAVLSVIMIMIAAGILPVPWRWVWVVDKFWDVLYLGVLISIAVIWAPSERAMQYALYSQPSADERGAEMVDLEDATAMGAHGTVGFDEEGKYEDEPVEGAHEAAFELGSGSEDGGQFTDSGSEGPASTRSDGASTRSSRSGSGSGRGAGDAASLASDEGELDFALAPPPGTDATTAATAAAAEADTAPLVADSTTTATGAGAGEGGDGSGVDEDEVEISLPGIGTGKKKRGDKKD